MRIFSLVRYQISRTNNGPCEAQGSPLHQNNSRTTAIESGCFSQPLPSSLSLCDSLAILSAQAASVTVPLRLPCSCVSVCEAGSLARLQEVTRADGRSPPTSCGGGGGGDEERPCSSSSSHYCQTVVQPGHKETSPSLKNK